MTITVIDDDHLPTDEESALVDGGTTETRQVTFKDPDTGEDYSPVTVEAYRFDGYTLVFILDYTDYSYTVDGHPDFDEIVKEYSDSYFTGA